jgi:hypothetical protein
MLFMFKLLVYVQAATAVHVQDLTLFMFTAANAVHVQDLTRA